MAKRSRPFQFSLRTKFIGMTVLAIACLGLFAGPEWVTGVTLMLIGALVPMALTVAVVYGRGYLRTFCIGGLFSMCPVVPVCLLLGRPVNLLSHRPSPELYRP